ncbi:hypothetical protein [Kitasatospora sp. NPDC056731]|uniref:hypothetical protein n=1 Tax=Kitasatospora sp. NPDC056731 TaxID=3155422 RepID=UPI00342644C9
MSASHVVRPTENLAIGRAILRPTPARTPADMFFLHLEAKFRRDAHGADLFYRRYERLLAAGKVGE